MSTNDHYDVISISEMFQMQVTVSMTGTPADMAAVLSAIAHSQGDDAFKDSTFGAPDAESPKVTREEVGAEPPKKRTRRTKAEIEAAQATILQDAAIAEAEEEDDEDEDEESDDELELDLGEEEKPEPVKAKGKKAKAGMSPKALEAFIKDTVIKALQDFRKKAPDKKAATERISAILKKAGAPNPGDIWKLTEEGCATVLNAIKE